MDASHLTIFHAGMVELVDSVDLGSTAKSVQVRVLLPAPYRVFITDLRYEHSFYTLRRVKRLFYALADVFLVNGALRYLWDVQVAYEAIANLNSLGAVFTGAVMVGSCFVS